MNGDQKSPVLKWCHVSAGVVKIVSTLVATLDTLVLTHLSNQINKICYEYIFFVFLQYKMHTTFIYSKPPLSFKNKISRWSIN